MSDKSVERQIAEHAGAAAVGQVIGLFAHVVERNRLQQAYKVLVYAEAWGQAFPTKVCEHCGADNPLVGLDDVCFSCGKLLAD